MFFFFIKESYALISAEYKNGIPLRQQRKELAEQFNRTLAETIKSEEEIFHPYIDESRILIIWKNADNIDELGHSVDELIAHFAREMAAYMNANSNNVEQVQLFIDSPKTLMSNSNDPMSILKRIALIHNETGIFPVFLENELWRRLDKKTSEAETHRVLENLAEQSSDVQERKTESTNRKLKAMESGLLSEKDANYIKYMCNMVNKVYALDGQEIKLSVREGSFINQYFKWQADEKPKVNNYIDAIENVGKTSFYKYASEFEANPFYAEYVKIYQHKLKGTYKKNSSIDPIAFINDYKILKATVDDEKFLDCLLSKYPEILSELDVPRIYMSCEKKIGVMKKKGLYKKALEEHGLESL